jgi:hypothetical protein
MQGDSLFWLCGLFEKRANLESDMAKRIMLSVLPHVMSPTERHYTGGYDQKALRSAALGAEKAVHYATEAAIHELGYYMSKDPDDDRNAEPTAIHEAAHSAFLKGDYVKALTLCERAFSDSGGWLQSYGGKKWQTIAATFLELEKARLEWQRIRREAPDHPERDNLKLELDAMKAVVVLLNRVDQLTHNTETVMRNMVALEAEDEGYAGTQRETKMQERIRNLQDAKEIKDPLAVYKEVEHIITLPEYRRLFGDYITRLKEHPGMKAYNPKAVAEEKMRIRMRKGLLEAWPYLESRFQALIGMKDELVKTKMPEVNPGMIDTGRDHVGRQHAKLLVEHMRDRIYKVIDGIKSLCFAIEGRTSVAEETIKPMGDLLTDVQAFSAELMKLYLACREQQDMLVRQDPLIRALPYDQIPGMLSKIEVEFVNFLHKAKRLYANVETLYHQF